MGELNEIGVFVSGKRKRIRKREPGFSTPWLVGFPLHMVVLIFHVRVQYYTVYVECFISYGAQISTKS